MNRHEPIQFLMTREVSSIQVNAPLSDARKLLAKAPFHHLPVCNGQTLVGILSKTDIRALTLESFVTDPETVDAWLDQQHSIAQVMTYEPIVLRPTETIVKAAEYFASGEFHALPVVDERNHLVGMLTTTDIARWVASA